MIYLYVMNVIRSFCLFFCALDVFLNVTYGNIVFGAVVHPSISHSESKQIALRKVASEVNFNAFEFEEDVELDESGRDFDDDLDMFISNNEGSVLTFNILSSSKYSNLTYRYRWENFRFLFIFRISGNSTRNPLTLKSIV